MRYTDSEEVIHTFSAGFVVYTYSLHDTIKFFFKEINNGLLNIFVEILEF